MTKKIRVENADTSTYKVVAHTEDLVNGEWVRQKTDLLEYPTALADLFIHSTRRVVIEEG